MYRTFQAVEFGPSYIKVAELLAEVEPPGGAIVIGTWRFDIAMSGGRVTRVDQVAGPPVGTVG